MYVLDEESIREGLQYLACDVWPGCTFLHNSNEVCRDKVVNLVNDSSLQLALALKSV